jgi:hypothetical protein
MRFKRFKPRAEDVETRGLRPIEMREKRLPSDPARAFQTY